MPLFAFLPPYLHLVNHQTLSFQNSAQIMLMNTNVVMGCFRNTQSLWKETAYIQESQTGILLIIPRSSFIMSVWCSLKKQQVKSIRIAKMQRLSSIGEGMEDLELSYNPGRNVIGITTFGNYLVLSTKVEKMLQLYD